MHDEPKERLRRRLIKLQICVMMYNCRYGMLQLQLLSHVRAYSTLIIYSQFVRTL